MENPKYSLGHMQDVICELGNIGIGSASTSLSYLLHLPIVTSTATLEPIHYEHLAQQQMNDEIIGVLFPFDKDVQGFALFLLEQEFVHTILKELFHQTCDFSEMERENRDMLQEISGIMISTYLSAIAEAAHIRMRIQLPAITVDIRGSIINDALSLILSQNQESYWLDHEFHIEGSDVKNHLFFMLSTDGIYKILDTLEVKK